MSSEWMDMKDVARELGIVPYTARRLMVRDSIPVLKLAGKWNIKRSDFEALMARRYGK
jgi:predicted site-specific integrase-resolvase